MTDIASLGIAVDSTQVAAGTASLDKLTAAGAAAEAQTKKLKDTNTTYQSSLKQMADMINAQNAAYNQELGILGKKASQIEQVTQRLGNQAKAYTVLGDAINFYNKLIKAGVDQETALKAATDGKSVSLNQLKDSLGLASTATVAATKASNDLSFANAGVTRSVIGVTRALIEGRMSYAIGDTITLTQRTGLMSAALASIPFVATAAGFIAMAVAAFQYNEEQRKLIDLSKGIGSAAGLTAAAIDDAAERGARAAGTSISAATKQAEAYAETGRIGSSIMEGLISITQKYANATGEKATKANADLAASFADPSKGVDDLNGKVLHLSQTQVEHIKNLQAEGDLYGAQHEWLVALQHDLDGVSNKTGFWATQLKPIADLWDMIGKGINASLAADARLTFPRLSAQLDAQAQAAAQTAAAKGAASQNTDFVNGVLSTAESNVGAYDVQTQKDKFQALADGANKALLLASAAGAAKDKINELSVAEQAYEHARDTYVDPTTKAHNISLAQQAANQPGITAQGKADAARALVIARTAGEVISNGDVKQQADDAASLAYDKKSAHTKDDSQQKIDQATSAIAAAKVAELQAQLGLTTDTKARFDLESEINDTTAKEKQSKTQGLIDRINSDHSISDATRKSLVSQLSQIPLEEQRTAVLKTELDKRKELDALTKDALDISNARIDAQSATLTIEDSLATTAVQKAEIENKILANAQAKAVADQQYILDLKGATVTQQKIAQIKLDELNADWGLKQQAEDQKTFNAINKEALDNYTNFANLQLDQLNAQKDTAIFDQDKQRIDLQILKVQQEIELAKLEELATQKGISPALKAYYDDLINLHKNVIDPAAISKINGNYVTIYQTLTSDLNSFDTSIKNHDWAGAANSLVNSFKKASDTITSSTSSFGDKLATVAAIAAQIGGLVGGASGSALSGAASGAMAGFTLGGPAGALAGGILGGVSSLIGFDSAQKAAQKAAEDAAIASNNQSVAAEHLAVAQQAATDAINKAASAATQRDSIEVALLTASGDAVGSLSLQRQIELASIDDTNKAMQQQLYNWQDYNAKVTASTTNVTTAQTNLNNAYSSAASLLQNNAKGFISLVSNLETFKQSLTTGALSQASFAQQYAVTKAQFEQTKSAAAGGDLTAIGNLSTVGQAFLTASQNSSSSLNAYLQDLAEVKDATSSSESYAQDQVTIAQKQLDALNDSVNGLVDIKNIVTDVAGSTQSTAYSSAATIAAINAVASAVSGLQTANASLSSLTANPPATPTVSAPTVVDKGYTSTNGDYIAYVEQNADLIAGFNNPTTGFANPVFQQTLTKAGFAATMAGFGQYQWEMAGQFQNRSVRPYDLGGVVTKPTRFEAGIMAENHPEAIMPLVNGPSGLGVRFMGDSKSSQNADVKNELQHLRSEMQAAMIALAKNTNELAKYAKRWENVGIPVRNPDPTQPIQVHTV